MNPQEFQMTCPLAQTATVRPAEGHMKRLDDRIVVLGSDRSLVYAQSGGWFA